MNRPQAFLVAFRPGQLVRLKCDPRQIGRVDAVFFSTTIKVRWRETGWKSEINARELEPAPGEEAVR